MHETLEGIRDECDALAREKQELTRQTATLNSRCTAQQQRTLAAERTAASLSLALETVTRERDALRKELDERTARPPEPPIEEVVAEVLPPGATFGAEEPQPSVDRPKTATPVPPPFRTDGGSAGKLAALEAQARRELEALQASGRIPDFLKR